MHEVPERPTTLSMLCLGQVLYSVAVQSGENETPIEISEIDKIGFLLSPREAGLRYEIRIGDFRISGKGEVVDVKWEDENWFESAVGEIRVQLRSRSVNEAKARWKLRATIRVVVRPGKIGADRYLMLVDDLTRLSGSLIFDLQGKSSASVQGSRQRRSAVLWSNQVQLRSLEHVVDRLGKSFDSILFDPMTVPVRDSIRRAYWGSERLTARTTRGLVTSGIDPRLQHSRKSLTAVLDTLVETTNTVEHRKIKHFVLNLARRVERCGESAREQLGEQMDLGTYASASSENVATDPDQSDSDVTTYAEQRRVRLIDAINRAAKLASRLRRIERSSVFRPLRPLPGPLHSPVFTNHPAYRAIALEAGALKRQAVLAQNGRGLERRQRTSKLYEWWVWMQVIAAFCELGLVVLEQDVLSAVEEVYTHRLTPGSRVRFEAHQGIVIMVEYEPTIDPLERAGKESRTLYGLADKTKTPDIVITISREEYDGKYRIISAFVIDAKYARYPRSSAFKQASKYLSICATGDDGTPIVVGSFIVHPKEQSKETERHLVEMENPAFEWSEKGTTISKTGRQHISPLVGYVGLSPTLDRSAADAEAYNILPPAAPAIALLASGILNMGLAKSQSESAEKAESAALVGSPTQ